MLISRVVKSLLAWLRPSGASRVDEFVGLSSKELKSLEGAAPVGNTERIVRFLFFPQMIDRDGKLTPSAFPIDEIIEDKGKSLSTTREQLALERGWVLELMCRERANPEKDRAAFGHAIGAAKSIRAIVVDSKSGEKLFDIVPDPVLFKGETDTTHAKVSSANPAWKKAFIRGFRDKLADAFNERIQY